MLTFTVETVWICLGSLALWAKARPHGASILLGAGVVAAAQIVGIITVFGWLGCLQRLPVLGAALFVNTALIIWARRDLLGTIRQMQKDSQIAWYELRHSKIVLGALILIVGIWTLMAGLGFVLPPTDWDGLAQHVPVAFFHLQANSLARIDTPYRGINAYPANGSILIEWAILNTGDDSLVDLVQWPFWLLGTIATYHLARRTGAGYTSAVLGSLVLATAPVVILQARSAYVDLTLAGLVLAGLALIVDAQLPLRAVIWIVGCALGIVLGLKYAGAINTVLVGLLLVIRIGIERRWSMPVIVKDLLAMALPMLLLGAHWYLRNWHDLGNPVWPITVQVGVTTLFEGVWTTASFYQDALPNRLVDLPYWAQLWTVWREPTTAYAPDMRLGGLGPLWLVAGLPCLLVFGLQSFLAWHPQRLALIGFALGVFFLTPANWHTRYVIAPAAIGCVAVALTLQQLSQWPRTFISGLVIVMGAYGFLITLTRGPVTPNDVARFKALPPTERRAIFADDVAAVGPAMRWFDRNIPSNTVVAYSWGGVILYPFWAQSPERQMVYVLPTDPSSIWYDTLRRRYVTHLVVRQGSVEARSAMQDSRFQPIYADQAYIIYALP